MILPHEKAERFFYLFDYLCIYAHKRLGVVSDDELFNGELPRGLSAQGQRETMHELWENPQVIEDYVRENPDHLSFEERALLRSWTNAYHTLIFVDRSASGKVWFFADDYAIDLCGLTKEPAAMLSETPLMIRTTLLPYGEYIVYDQNIMMLSIDMGPGVLDTFSSGLRAALAEGRILRTGDELAALVPTFKQHHLDAQMEQFRHDMEMEERANGEIPGQHRGALAGIRGKQRDDAIAAQMDDMSTFDRVKLLDKWCLPGEPLFGLEELLAASGDVPDIDMLMESFDNVLEKYRQSSDDKSLQIARVEELKAETEEFRAAQLAEGKTDSLAPILVEEFTDPDYIREVLSYMSEDQIEDLRALVDAGGHQTFPDDNMQLKGLKTPPPIKGLCYLFHTNGAFHAVVPREIVPVVSALDWNDLLADARLKKQLSLFADAIIDLRGIAKLNDVLDEFSKSYDDGSHSLDEISDMLLIAIEGEHCSAEILDTGDTMYLLHYELAWEYLEERGDEPYEHEAVIDGPLNDLLQGLLNQQQGKEPRPVPPEMMELDSPFDWRFEQPPALALLDYLDEHIPDDADDYFFADKVMEDALQEQRWGIVKDSVSRFFDILDENGFVPHESQAQKLLTLWQNLCNGLPCWPNNGWSPNELQNRLSGRRLFYNPDGSLMRVGRNDPCPCGSGKKYKRCCGR